MKFGHRGANHPVKNLITGKIEITSQNHSFAIDKNSLEGTGLELTHVNVIDGELEGVRDLKNHVMSIQYHPESAAGPEDSEYLFKQYIVYELPNIKFKSTAKTELKENSPLLSPNAQAFLKKEKPTALDKLICNFAVKMHKAGFFEQAYLQA